MLLLDTHAWIWSVEGDVSRIGRRARRLIAAAETRARILVSVVTLCELAALHTAERLRLARPIEQWIRDAIDLGGMRLAELSPAIAVDAGAIPRTVLADSMDRLLVATARQLDAVLLTGDRRILDYASATGRVRVADAGK